MRKFILVGAAALMLASAVGPATAGGLFFFPSNLCKEGPNGPFQRQCASNNFTSANNSSQGINQNQGGKARGYYKIKGLAQDQKASNLKIFGDGGFQGISQDQYLKLKNSTADGKHSATQKQNADNIVFAGNADQYINQSQNLTAKNVYMWGTQQSQTATNTAVFGHGNYQEINQSQSFDLKGSGYGGYPQ